MTQTDATIPASETPPADWRLMLPDSTCCLYADVHLKDRVVDLCLFEESQGWEASVRLNVDRARTLHDHLEWHANGTDLSPSGHGWTIDNDTLTLVDDHLCGLITLTKDVREVLGTRLRLLTEILSGPPAFTVFRPGPDGLVHIGDDQGRHLLDTDDDGVMGLFQLARDSVRAESRDLRSRHYHERLHTLPGADGSLVITRRDAAAFMDGKSTEVTVDAHVTLRTRNERQAFVDALKAMLPRDKPEHARPADELWSAH